MIIPGYAHAMNIHSVPHILGEVIILLEITTLFEKGMKTFQHSSKLLTARVRKRDKQNLDKQTKPAVIRNWCSEMNQLYEKKS